MEDVIITLVSVGETADKDKKTEVFATKDPIGRDEFNAAGQARMKARHKFTIWASEYDNQEEVEFDGNRLSIYRTYGTRRDGKIELYTAERAGNGS